MGDDAYNALPDSEKAQHADIITIIAQSNGIATLMIENLLVRAADAEETTWIERLPICTHDTFRRPAYQKTAGCPSRFLCSKTQSNADNQTSVLLLPIHFFSDQYGYLPQSLHPT